MADFPPDVAAFIERTLVESVSPAYFLVADDGAVLEAGGCQGTYGAGSLKPGDSVYETFDFLSGYIPVHAERLPVFLSCLKAGQSWSADIYLYPVAGATRIIFLDATIKEAQLSVLQQQVNESGIIRERHRRLFSQYIGQAALDSIQSNPDAISCERRNIAVLFADIRDFTAFSEREAPDTVFFTLNAYLVNMAQAVTDEGGFVDKYIGDAVMAVFGLAEDGRNPSAAALATAFRMQKRIAELNLMRVRNSAPALSIGVGIATGPAIVGILGSRARKSFTAIGHTVNLASRLVSRTKPGEILLDRSTREAVVETDREFQLVELALPGIAGSAPYFLCTEHGRNG